MFTVLIAEKEHIDAIQQENKLFFEPFLKNKELAFCCWNPAGQNLSDSVPGLQDVVGRKKEWRAVIINNCSKEHLELQNPFDVVDYSGVKSIKEPSRLWDSDTESEKWEAEWSKYYEKLSKEKETVYKKALSNPLQKLCTRLCFKPEDYILNDVEEKKDVNDWAMEVLSRDEIKFSTKLEHMERDQYRRDIRTKENIRREFINGEYLNIAYPSEIYCISLRTAKNAFFDPDTFWNVRQENDYSTFSDRNMYFDKMRFMVFDLLPRTHRNFRNDYIRFLASVLIFISNDVPSSVMQARHLYALETETDDTPLCTLITSYNRKLDATYEVIENEMEKIRSEIPGELNDKTVESMFCSSKDSPILKEEESFDFEKLLAEKNYGLFYDSPENEHHKWSCQFEGSKKALINAAKQQMRSLRKAGKQLSYYGDVSDINISRLTPFQMDDIREYTDATENEMIDSIPSNFKDVSAYVERIEEESKNVKKVIDRRMNKKTVFILGSICLALYLLCFTPFLLTNTNTIKMSTVTVVLSISMLLLLVIIMAVAVFSLRLPLINALKNYNNIMIGIINDIKTCEKGFLNYLGASYSVQRGHFVQNYASKNLDEYTKKLRIRKKHQEDIKKRKAFLAEEYQDYICDSSYCDETLTRPYEYDFDQKTEYDYPVPFLAGDIRQIEFLNSGNFVSVPSSYVTRISVRMEGIYEK